MKDSVKEILVTVKKWIIMLIFVLSPLVISNILFCSIFRIKPFNIMKTIIERGNILIMIVYCIKESLLCFLFLVMAFNILKKKYLKNVSNKKIFNNILLSSIFLIHYYNKEYPKEIREIAEKDGLRFDSITAKLVSFYSDYTFWFLEFNLMLLLPRIIFPGHDALNIIGSIITTVIIILIVPIIPGLIHHNNYIKKRTH